SNKMVWWRCKKDEHHEWSDTINNRSNGRNCPFCSNHRVSGANSLAAVNPKLAREWHPSKNHPLKPSEVLAGSDKTVWWKCDEADDHEWPARIYSRSKSGCPMCSQKVVVSSNCLATTHPELSEEWHPTKNGELTPYNVTAKSSKRVWWKCKKGDDHEWEGIISRRLKGSVCQICNLSKSVRSNSLATTNPKLAKEWHPSKNGNLTPNSITARSSKKVWWKCEKGDDHEWQAKTSERLGGFGCTICSGNKVVKSNCLATINPRLAKQWHPTKNQNLTPADVVAQSNKSVWWLCDKYDDHEWRTSTNNRSNGTNCPFCTLTPQSKQELTITFELIRFFKGINPRGFKVVVGGQLKTIDIFIPELNLGIEFDGSYWHKDKEAKDKLKTEKLKEAGLNIIRIREEPLTPIFETDIVSSQPFNGKEVTNKLLRELRKKFILKDEMLEEMDSYLCKGELQNQGELDKYIEAILAEKALPRQSTEKNQP
ncbi:zinc-ribbon domain-containing protein, partial [Akkermansiaceae bacterium]|nr:zinc-ribbon domain-containing protein [Akkermansiaceae bacterium]